MEYLCMHVVNYYTGCVPHIHHARTVCIVSSTYMSCLCALHIYHLIKYVRNVHIYRERNVCTCQRMCVCASLCVYIHACACIHICSYTYIYIYIYVSTLEDSHRPLKTRYFYDCWGLWGVPGPLRHA